VTDALVVGGGAAGCVLAAWLSEDPGCEVTLLEVAPDLVGVAALPADVVDASGPILAHDWGYSRSRTDWGGVSRCPAPSSSGDARRPTSAAPCGGQGLLLAVVLRWGHTRLTKPLLRRLGRDGQPGLELR